MDIKEIECEAVLWIEPIQDMSFVVLCKLGNVLRLPEGMDLFLAGG
jgi:hypothetical protein